MFCLRIGDMWPLYASIFICRQISTCKLSALKSLSQRSYSHCFYRLCCGLRILLFMQIFEEYRAEEKTYLGILYFGIISFDGGAMKNIIVVVKTISCPYLTADTTTEKALDFMWKILTSLRKIFHNK